MYIILSLEAYEKAMLILYFFFIAFCRIKPAYLIICVFYVYFRRLRFLEPKLYNIRWDMGQKLSQNHILRHGRCSAAKSGAKNKKKSNRRWDMGLNLSQNEYMLI